VCLFNIDRNTDRGIQKLTNLPLKELLLAGTSVTGSVFKSPGALHGLVVLNLDHTPIEPNLAALEQLELSQLHLSNCHLTDGDMDTVCKLRTIRTLYLNGNSITRQGLARLATMPSLNFLAVQNCNLTKQDEVYIKKLLEAKGKTIKVFF
jgi:Leucine-rich repeat (LRR) protein